LIQLQDASLMTGMKAIGDIRNNIQQNAAALAQLEADANSTDPNMESTKALQQKTLIAMLMLIHTLQDSNRALTASVDLQVQELAQQRWDRGREFIFSYEIGWPGPGPGEGIGGCPGCGGGTGG
jgi:hypothetical protein